MGENQDLSKIIGLIMENPDIIEKIKGLADNSGTKTTEAVAGEVESENLINTDTSPKEEAVASATYVKAQSKKRRRELLTALKPYVKSERAKAIDTMLSVIDVIDVMKER